MLTNPQEPAAFYAGNGQANKSVLRLVHRCIRAEEVQAEEYRTVLTRAQYTRATRQAVLQGNDTSGNHTAGAYADFQVWYEGVTRS